MSPALILNDHIYHPVREAASDPVGILVIVIAGLSVLVLVTLAVILKIRKKRAREKKDGETGGC